MNLYNKAIHRTFKKIVSIPLLLFLCLACVGCAQSHTEKTSRSGFYFDTVITLTIYDPPADSENILDNAFLLCESYEQKFSRTLQGSDIKNINDAAGHPVAVSEDTIFLLETALYYAELSNGLIDPTIAPVKDLWNFSADSNATVPPDSDALTQACSHIDYHHVVLDKDTNTVTLTDPAAGLDLGFIAKGYIADRLKEYLLAQGIKHAIIDLGGNILCIGSKPDGSAYRVGIRYPFGSASDMITSLSCSDQSIVTSGIYERYFYLDDVIYHHILDTKTGYPVRNNLLSVTILSPSSVQGDALSTLCYIYGLEDGMALVESLEDVEAVFITDDYELHSSSGLAF
ncbi:MAG: FAD:protein FMN transferase [Lachnospiraceae bacterium]